MYGTRDAGAIWEQCYVDCLIDLGFQQGIASPCCFKHEKWGVSVVVHGDDFTALGTDESLDLYEAGLQKAFECKICGRLGTDKKDDKEIRILNRIVRITDEGLMYEADPRHVELLAKSLGLQDCKPVATPGIKRPFENQIMDPPISQESSTLSPITERCRRVSFHKEPKMIATTAYSEVYGIHPSKFVFGRGGVMIRLRESDDPYTGVSNEEMKDRRGILTYDHEARSRVLRKTLLDGCDWEESTADLVAKVSPKKFKQKRLGAKAAKAANRFESKG